MATFLEPNVVENEGVPDIGANRIRVALCTDSFMRGGTERQFVRLATHLDRSLFDIHVVCLKRTGPLAAEIEGTGLPITEFRLTSLHNVRAFQQAMVLRAFLRKRRIEVIHAFDFYTDVFAIPAARAAAVPVVLASRRELLNLRTPWQQRAVKLACRMATGVVVNSMATANDAIRARLTARNRVHIIPNCIELRDFDREPDIRDAVRTNLGVPKSAPVVGTLCVLRPEKDLQTFLRACAIVRKSIPAARFLIVGDGVERQKLEQLADELRLREAVVFAGDCEDVPSMLAAMDVFLLTSRTESFPNAVLEAMACKRAVLASNVGGVSEVVGDGENGYLATPGDADQFASRAIDLLRDSNRRLDMGARGFAKAKAQYSVESVSQRLQSLYCHLLQAKSGQRGFRVRHASK